MLGKKGRVPLKRTTRVGRAKKSGSAPGEKRDWVYFVFLFLVLWLLPGRAMYYQYVNVPVEVNGKPMLVKRGSSVSEVIQQARLRIGGGRLVDVDGRVLESDGGHSVRIQLNGCLVSAGAKSGPGDVVEAVPGSDRREGEVVEEVSVPPPVRLEGRGPLIQVAQVGEPGIMEVVLGARSRKIVEGRLKKRPSPRVFTRSGQSAKRAVTLTFDDGPHPDYTPRILEVLRSHEIPATFFVVGREAKKYPDILRKIVADGHTVGNHSFTHSSLPGFSQGEIESEIEMTEQAIESATHERSEFFRPPYGEFNLGMLDIMTSRGYTPVLWNVDPSDWSQRTSGSIYGRVVAQVRPGSIILLHDGGGKQDATVAALPRIITALKAGGYSFIRVEEMLAEENKVAVSGRYSRAREAN